MRSNRSVGKGLGSIREEEPMKGKKIEFKNDPKYVAEVSWKGSRYSSLNNSRNGSFKSDIEGFDDIPGVNVDTLQGS